MHSTYRGCFITAGRMKNIKGYIAAPFEPGKPLSGYALAIVKQSKSTTVPEGALVIGSLQWQQLQVVAAENVIPVDTGILTEMSLPASLYLNVLGMVGMTA
jgi:NADPH:quinone reductase